MIYTNNKLPIYAWSGFKSFEEGALKQADNLANLPFAYHHIALMPDCHQGYGMPIGGVLATENVVVPNAVGVDIGCGVRAMKINNLELTQDQLRTVMGTVREKIPVGFNKHSKVDDSVAARVEEFGLCYDDWEYYVVIEEYENSLLQLGTLGGGNHFIEFQKDSDGNLWVMIHSGSRNLGKKVADYYNKLAIAKNQLYYSSVTKESELAFFPLTTEDGQKYIEEMKYCVKYAELNRTMMMERIQEILLQYSDSVCFESPIDVSHNYARIERHYGKDVVIHRKGATSAKLNEIGIIPGSQGTKSYIVRGRGSRISFESCSHGAGRLMGRNVARKTLNLNDEIQKLNDMGVVHSIRNVEDLDEAPSAYKNIDEVMENQNDLIEIVETLHPLAVIKG